MEYVEGASLAELIGAVEVPPRVALEIGEEVAGALAVAFEKPTRSGPPLALLHRDIKPSNVQITPAGEVKLLDFGIARASFEGREAQTRAMIMGSLPYMGPERFDFEDTHGGDVYALAVTVCEALIGEAPRRAPLEPDVHAAFVQELLDKVKGRIDHPELLAFLKQALDYETDRRPTARAFERAMRQIRGSVEGPWLKDWAETAVMPALAARELAKDALSGEILSAGTLASGGALRTVAPLEDDEADEAPEPVVEAPRRRRRWLWWVLGGLGTVAAGVLLAVLLGGGVFLAAFGWFASLVLDESIEVALVDVEAQLDLLADQPNKTILKDMIVGARLDPRVENIGLWEVSMWGVHLDEATQDGKITDVERSLLTREFEGLLAE
jgi:serine/threonine-protein kinase